MLILIIRTLACRKVLNLLVISLVSNYHYFSILDLFKIIRKEKGVRW